MDISIFLARCFGLYILIFAAIWILRPKSFETVLQNIIASKGLIGFSGMFSLLLGLAIVIIHPIWGWDWRVVITILGYLMIIQGIIRIAFTEKLEDIANKAIEYKWVIVGFWIVLGIFLTYFGFA